MDQFDSFISIVSINGFPINIGYAYGLIDNNCAYPYINLFSHLKNIVKQQLILWK